VEFRKHGKNRKRDNEINTIMYNVPYYSVLYNNAVRRAICELCYYSHMEITCMTTSFGSIKLVFWFFFLP